MPPNPVEDGVPWPTVGARDPTPKVPGPGLRQRGFFAQIDGLTYYITGNEKATKGIFFLYDIYGFTTQALQGADILAYDDPNQDYLVFIPDLFDGDRVHEATFDLPRSNPVRKHHMDEFLAKSGAHERQAARIPGLLDSIDRVYASAASTPQITTWGIVGLCWGAKLVSLTSAPCTRGRHFNCFWTSAAQCHPSFMVAADAETIDVPMLVLSGPRENKKELDRYLGRLKVEKYSETFEDMYHGWMGGRNPLGRQREVDEFRRGYEILLWWFGKTLKSKEELVITGNSRR